MNSEYSDYSTWDQSTFGSHGEPFQSQSTEFEHSPQDVNSYPYCVTIPVSFRLQHSFLDNVFNSYTNPEEISASRLDAIAQQANLPMREILLWFGEERYRRQRLEAQFQYRHSMNNVLPQTTWSVPSPQTSNMSFTTLESNNRNGTEGLISPQVLTPCFSPASSTSTLLTTRTKNRRGRHPKNASPFSPPPSSTPSKRPKLYLQYPCVDCKRVFPAKQWPEHIKRVHFPDFVWECPKQNCNASTKPFFRPDNFATHLEGEHDYSKAEVCEFKHSCKFEVVNFFHRVCGFCDESLNGREESSEHIKEHLKLISERTHVPRDLGLSEWQDKCGCEHVLRRGVHYRLEGDAAKQDDGLKIVQGDRHDGPKDDSYHGNTFYSEGTRGFVANESGTNHDQSFEVMDFGYDLHSSYSSNTIRLHPPTPPHSQHHMSLRNTSSSQEWNFSDEPLSENGRCPYPDCGNIYKDLKAHLLTHQNERPHKCPIRNCDYHTKGFARQYDRTRHVLTHYKGEMTCGFCLGKTFNRADVFKRHLTSVHGVQQTPFPAWKEPDVSAPCKSLVTTSGNGGKCSTCSFSFADPQMFYEHLDNCVLELVQFTSEEPIETQNQLAEILHGSRGGDVSTNLESGFERGGNELVVAEEEDPSLRKFDRPTILLGLISEVKDGVIPVRRRQRQSLACTECRRRKQKCDYIKDRVACGPCARRYPPVECNIKELDLRVDQE